jgi:hypothetical protein
VNASGSELSLSCFLHEKPFISTWVSRWEDTLSWEYNQKPDPLAKKSLAFFRRDQLGPNEKPSLRKLRMALFDFN